MPNVQWWVGLVLFEQHSKRWDHLEALQKKNDGNEKREKEQEVVESTHWGRKPQRTKVLNNNVTEPLFEYQQISSAH